MQSDMSLDRCTDHRKAASPSSFWKTYHQVSLFKIYFFRSNSNISWGRKKASKQRLWIQLTSESFLPEAGHDKGTELHALSLTVWETVLCSTRPRAANCKEKRTKIKSYNNFICNATETRSGLQTAKKKREFFWEKTSVGQCCTENKDLSKQFLVVSFKQCNKNL